MGVVKDIFKKLHVLANKIPAHKRDSFFKPLLPAVTTFCQTFPPLCAEATELLLYLGQLCLVTETYQAPRAFKSLPRPEVGLSSQQGDSAAGVSEEDAGASKGSLQLLPGDRSCDPTMLLEDKLAAVSQLSLVEAVQCVFQEVVTTSLLRAAAKT